MQALLLIDLQVDFLDPAGRLPVGTADAERVIAVANRTAALFAAQGWPIIVIHNQFRKDDVIGNFFRKSAALEGSAGAEIDPRVIVPIASYFSKAASSAFTNPELAAYLQAAAIDRVVICGVYAEGCVRATALAARQAGLATVVLADGVASNRQAKYKWALSQLRKRGIEVLSTPDYLATAPG